MGSHPSVYEDEVGETNSVKLALGPVLPVINHSHGRYTIGVIWSLSVLLFFSQLTSYAALVFIYHGDLYSAHDSRMVGTFAKAQPKPSVSLLCYF